jgi:UV DNA damage endonuclease
MHPDQFTLLNSPDENVFRRSLKELEYHQQVLDLMELDRTAKIQIHVGGVYKNKQKALERFRARSDILTPTLRKRLVIEHDDRLYSLSDCLRLSKRTGIPVVFDTLHHECHNNGEKTRTAMISAQGTWTSMDGILMVDYSLQKSGAKKGKHAESIDMKAFKSFLDSTKNLDFDIMLEIKDKEKSAMKALSVLTKKTRGGKQ